MREKQVSDGLWFGLGFLLVMFGPPPAITAVTVYLILPL